MLESITHKVDRSAVAHPNGEKVAGSFADRPMWSPGWRQTHKGRNSGGLWWNSGGLHGVGSTDLHGVAETNCTNTQKTK